MRLRTASRREDAAYRVFFATDIHGSDRCFRKFVAAAEAYKAHALILGGDVAGKAIVPILAEGGRRYSATFHGRSESLTEEELGDFVARVNFNGFYPRIVDASELDLLLDDSEHRDEVFTHMIAEQIRGWCELARDRLVSTVRLVITPGNDDPAVVDRVLLDAERVEFTELEVVELGPVWLASLGNTNRTPWATEREFDEPELATQIESMLVGYPNGRPLAFNFHCPPLGSGLDTVVQLDSDFKPVVRNGRAVEVPAGSTAVLEAVERYQPTIALHGHIHESRGAKRIGETMCLNPGSDYSTGVLKGVIVDLTADGAYAEHLFTSG